MKTTTPQVGKIQGHPYGNVPAGTPAFPDVQPAAAPAPRSSGACVPAVSVVIPTYNRVQLLSEALDSVAAQTFRDYEIIIIDDGSADQTREAVEQRKEPIRYAWQRNQGVSEARNHALRLTHSEFVAFLDSDDLWEPTFLERAIERLRAHPDEALVYTDFVSTDASGVRRIRGHRKTPRGGSVTAELFASTFIHTSAVVARAHIVRDAGGFDGRLTHNEDYDLWLRLSVRHRFGLIDEPLCRRRCHPSSLSRDGCQPETLQTKAELLERFYTANGEQARIAAALAHHRLAKLYYAAGKRFLKHRRPHEALPLLRRALQLHPTRARTWFWAFLAEVSTTFHPAPQRRLQPNR
jgi:glycosyltransferase involved in cell wall biosynthesis